jgi:hypothetical protein
MQTEAVVLLDDEQCQELDAFLVERIYEFNSNATGAGHCTRSSAIRQLSASGPTT